MTVSRIITPAIALKVCISLVLIVQAMMPSYAVAFGTNSRFDAAHYFCNSLTAEPEDAAKVALREVLTLAGKLEPVSEQPNHANCDNCVITLHVFTAPHAQSVDPSPYQSESAQLSAQINAFFYPAQGPPIGGRAPPLMS